MPLRLRTRARRPMRRRVRRTVRRRRLGPVRVPRRPNVTTVLPKRLFTKLKYASEAFQVITTTGIGSHQFAANGLFDPDQTGVGHQPMGFDQLTAIYNDYRVHACMGKVYMRIINGGPTSILGVYFNPTNVLNTSITELMERGNVRTRQIDGVRPHVLSKFARMSNITGKAQSILRNDLDYSAGVGGNPPKQLYFTIQFQNIDSTTSTEFEFRVELTYWCEFNNLKTLTIS